MDDLIKRRAEFLLNEARLNAKRDQVITFIMRVLSNHATVGSDASSFAIKKKNPRISRRALLRLNEVEVFTDWSKDTINEHPLPLKSCWEWLLLEAKNLKVEDVWDYFNKYPMTTILKKEDKKLNAHGFRSSGGSSRYLAVGIEIVELDISPAEHFKRRMNT